MGHAATRYQVQLGSWEQLGPQATRIRDIVFVQEQKVPVEIEMDAFDGLCLHVVAHDQITGAPIGTGRLLPDGHIGRMAVLAPWRAQGVGSLLLTALVQAARERGQKQVMLAAQLHARPFYSRHGFVAQGATFMDAGIEHVLMLRQL